MKMLMMVPRVYMTLASTCKIYITEFSRYMTKFLPQLADIDVITYQTWDIMRNPLSDSFIVTERNYNVKKLFKIEKLLFYIVITIMSV